MKQQEITPGQITKILQTAKQKGVTEDRFQLYGLGNGLIADAFEAIAAQTPQDRDVWRQALGLSPFIPIEETDLLRPVAKYTIPARTMPFDLNQFYRTPKGIRIPEKFMLVDDDFKELLDIRSREVVASAPERTYVSLEMKNSACAYNILEKLPKPYSSTLEDIAALIELQWNGFKGILHNDGRGNTCFVERNREIIVVTVLCVKDGRVWSVTGQKLDDFVGAGFGSRVFCPSNATLRIPDSSVD